MSEKKDLFEIGDKVITAVDLFVGGECITRGSNVTITGIDYEGAGDTLYSFKTEDGTSFNNCLGVYLINPDIMPEHFIRPPDQLINTLIVAIKTDRDELKQLQSTLHDIDKLIKGLKNGTPNGSISIFGYNTLSTHNGIRIPLDMVGVGGFKDSLVEALLERAREVENDIDIVKTRLNSILSKYDLDKEEE